MIQKAASGRSFDSLLARLRIAFAPPRPNQWMWLETVVISLCTVALGLIFQRDNPFQIGAEFPWPWLAPVLLALRYGVMSGVASSLVLIAVWLLLAHLVPGNSHFPEQYFLGGLILVMLCGEFSAAWATRLRRAEETNHYLDERLSRITRRHLLLRLSHERMEQEVLSKPATLRDTLTGLRQLTVAQTGSSMPAAYSLLQLLTQYCQLESAAIFTPAADGAHLRSSEIGSPPDLKADDPLLLHALEHKSLAHLLTGGLPEGPPPSPFLVVAPIITSDGYLLGVLAINRMPFFALNEETLQTLSVMLGYYADCVVEAEGTRRFLERLPAAPHDFAGEFSRLLHLQQGYGIDSHIVVLVFHNDERVRQAVVQLARIRRGLDVIWQAKDETRLVIANLMPLSNEAAVEGYMLRIEAWLNKYMGSDHDELSVTPFDISLAESDPVASLIRVIKGTAA